MNAQRWIGILACLLLMISCWMHWAWYPDIKEYFTGFYSKQNYYGRPGVLLTFCGGFGVLMYALKKIWADRLNLIFAAIAAAYAFTSFLRFSSSYDGFVPEKQAGIFLMLISALIHVGVAIFILSIVKTKMEPNTAQPLPEEK